MPETRRQSLRRFAYDSNDVNAQGSKDSPNELPVTTPSSTPTPRRGQSNVLGKRKRNGPENPPTTSDPALSDTPPKLRSSPRKAPKLDPATSTHRKPKRQPAQRTKAADGTVTVHPPPRWEEVYAATAAMRRRVPAPVDTMGCETLAEDTASPADRRLQTLVALMLSSQTKDTVTAAAMRALQEGLPGGFTLESLRAVPAERLNELIGKVGFHNNKTKFIKAVAEILRDEYDGDIPDSIEGLVALPGVGPKMAYLCMSAAWGRDEGIGVDVHVHRITNLWGWHKTSTPEQTRAELESWLPREKWHDINHLLVGFGQTYCPPVGRKCDGCDLSALKLCPSAVAGSPVKRKVKKEVEVKVEDGLVVKEEEVEVETDDVATSVHIKSEAVGEVEMQLSGSPQARPLEDIEDLGAGILRETDIA